MKSSCTPTSLNSRTSLQICANCFSSALAAGTNSRSSFGTGSARGWQSCAIDLAGGSQWQVRDQTKAAGSMYIGSFRLSH